MTPYSRTQVVLLLVLLVSFLELPPTHEYQVLEFYAGVGRIAAMSKYVGYRSCALDVEYGRERFDKQGKRSPMDINSDSGLVLAIHLLLHSEFEAAVAVLAVVCSSMVPVNRGSTDRSFMTPLGNEYFLAVRKSNKLTSRSVLCMLLLVALGGTYLMENPVNSLVALHPRYVWFCARLQELGIPTYKIAFWMRKYKAMSYKRTWIWSISSQICSLDLGSLTASERQGCTATTTRYRDKNGKLKFKGNSNLKRSQQYTYKFASKIVQLVPKIRKDTKTKPIPIQVQQDSFQNLFANMNFSDECRAWDAGISLVKMETGMDPLRASDAAIAEELAKLQDMLQHVAMIGAPEEPPRNDYQDVSADVGNDSMESLDHELCHDDPYDYGFFHQADEVGATADDCADMWQTLQAALNEVAELRATPPKPKESFIRRCRRKIEFINEQDLYAEGEFLSEQDLIEQEYKETRINAIKAECAKRKGWIRRDRYEKHVKLYWVETKLGGKNLQLSCIHRHANQHLKLS
ncbi:unnamed protein product [Cladocopium goreaui]|uniref:Uncharacterized protein n=1 Tax=Cladocopium goreaui TaxID=2562237 RepID=A0A9P1CYM1_9DINO|nr:unnamed protein product [Cladocopium goreaui]